MWEHWGGSLVATVVQLLLLLDTLATGNGRAGASSPGILYLTKVVECGIFGDGVLIKCRLIPTNQLIKN